MSARFYLIFSGVMLCAVEKCTKRENLIHISKLYFQFYLTSNHHDLRFIMRLELKKLHKTEKDVVFKAWP